MLVDIVIPPFYNKMPQVMKLYDVLLKSRVESDVNIIIVNNGSIDGMRPSNFHVDKQVKYVSSDVRVNECFLLTHAIMKEAKSEFVNILSWNAEVTKHYISNMLSVLENCGTDILLGGIESYKSKRSTIRIPDRRSMSTLKMPEDFFCENIVFKRTSMMKGGLFDSKLNNISNATKMLCYNMIKAHDATYNIDKTFSCTLPSIPKQDVDKNLNNTLIDYDAYKYTYKNYIDNNVYKIARGVESERFYSAPINAFIIFPTKNNERLEDLIRQQKAKGDKLYISNLPKYMSKRLGYIFQKHNQFDRVIVIHENGQFQLPYFIDNFKRQSATTEDMILATDDDFTICDLRPSDIVMNMSICVPRQFLWEPGLNETLDWNEFIRKLATLQPDQKIGDLLNPPKRKKAEIINTSGDGGPVRVAAIPKKHKKSWYDWMED
jgi:hypothetical protein